MSTDMRSTRHANESAISSISVVMVAVLAISMMQLGHHFNVIGRQHALARGSTVNLFPQQAGQSQQVAQKSDPQASEVEVRFQQAVYMLHAGHYDDAITALHRVIELSPRMPEAYVNMGFALFGLQRYQAAHDFFEAATDIRPYQGNAYWGIAITLEKLGDLEGALGAMRTYIHLAKPNDPYVTRARSALWEWESTLKRGPVSDEERQFVKRGEQQWVDRNSPDRDAPDKGDHTIMVRSIN